MLMQTLSALKGTQCRGMYTWSLLEVSKPCKPEALATTSKKLLWEVLHHNSMATSLRIACLVKDKIVLLEAARTAFLQGVSNSKQRLCC